MSPVQESLQTWREAERVLDALPPVDPDRQAVSLAIERRQQCYRQVTDSDGLSVDVIETTSRTLEDAHGILIRVKAKGPRVESGLPEAAVG
jgi:hypothetical protein